MTKIYSLKIALLILIINVAKAQIPNPSFENWTSQIGYKTPDGWDQANSTTAITGIFTTTKGTPGFVGNAYIKLNSKTIVGAGVVPGIAVSGKVDHATFKPISGVPYTTRSQTFTGNYQYSSVGIDAGIIFVSFTKWNTSTSSRDTVATAYQAVIGTQTSWTPFALAMQYRTAQTPDSMMIVFSSSAQNGVDGSYLYVDNLSFTGTVSSINKLTTNANFGVYPNPTSKNITLNYIANTTGVANITISDVKGTIVKKLQQQCYAGAVSNDVNVSEFSAGTYVITVTLGNDIITKKIIVE
jgi:hypothetical protein